MSRTIRIGLGQMHALLGDVPANIKTAEDMIHAASEGKADILLLPELCFTGYQLSILGKDIYKLSDAYYSQIDQAMQRAAAQEGLYVIAGMCRREQDAYYNIAKLYGPDGVCAGEYKKAFAFANERDYFASGMDFPVFNTSMGKIGILICYDIGFPETARRLNTAGAEIIFVPAAWRIEDELSWDLNVPSRALENQCYVAAVNNAGVYGNLNLFGKSMLCGPDGRTILQLGYDRQMLGICEIDLSVLQKLREQPGYQYDYLRSAAINGDPREALKTSKN